MADNNVNLKLPAFISDLVGKITIENYLLKAEIKAIKTDLEKMQEIVDDINSDKKE